MRIIDSHIHCGVQNVHQPYERIAPLLTGAGIETACLFAPVEDIYDRYDIGFEDDDAWRRCRRSAHDYLLRLSMEKPGVIPYYFVWNDFTVEDLEKPFRGIKWHHHPGEPEYRYQDPRCMEMIEAICSRKLPIVLEETFERTQIFIRQVAGRTAVIIPHLGMLNGGFQRLRQAGVWAAPDVYADTALAGRDEIRSFIADYGTDRLIFGSDYPFGMPAEQLAGVQSLGLGEDEMTKICGENISRLLRIKR